VPTMVKLTSRSNPEGEISNHDLNRKVGGSHRLLKMGTRESFWTRHDVGDHRANRERKREPGDGHVRDCGSFSCARSGRRTRRASAGGQVSRHRQTPDGRGGGPLATSYRRKISSHLAPGRTTGVQAASSCDVARRRSAKIPPLTNAPLRKVRRGRRRRPVSNGRRTA